jgi:hypothetical protein
MTEPIPTPGVLDKTRGERATESLLAHVRDLREQADALLSTDLSDLSCDDTTRVLHEIQMARKTLQASEEFYINHIHEKWPGGDYRVPHHVQGVGVVRAFRGKDRKTWQHEALVHAVVDKHLAAADGEIPDPFTVAGWIRECAGIGYWKTGALKAIGIEPDEFCESTKGTRTVSISHDDTIGDTTP